MPLTLATTTPGEPEIFASLQGEGPSMGKPCTFIRLSRCNLACEWCDTAYTWHFEGDNRPHRRDPTYPRAANQLTLSEEDAARQIAAFGQDRLIITGGEPLLQGAALARMLGHLPGMIVEIETNGSVAPHPALDPLVSQYNVSPKLAHSGNPADLALNPERLAHWTQEPRATFKFVIAEPADVDEVLALQKAHTIPSAKIMLMAEGTEADVLEQRESWLAEICIAQKLTLSKRLHIRLFGDTRGT
ncbi:7-carboxy-7-deazaguanine synthase QueE [Altericroceibacterium spongiae]|uniref:7-carboxy-7-deazaguanine synthase n=1 Tax=Altericroceibacterium spongiae TaxID=2320269 RepID=A0A420EK93_9SPHN|nr:7-carboxy-7-deazaguanine synthase QueE [Altericroceibacterium spongiae]RKF21093.1 7-carboxy-7-deazaguanine synthase QueE [Altericroceibacterium spongiae]